MMAFAPKARGLGRIYAHEPMARHTSWRVGGPAAEFYIPATTEDLALFVRERTDPAPVWVGLGSNILVRDAGIPGSVVLTTGLKQLEIDGNAIYAEAGVPTARVARVAADAGLSGAEFLAGIPGTVGGALAMNAGAFGGETWALVHSVQTMDGTGQLRWRNAGEFVAGYRTVRMPAPEWFVAARFVLGAEPASQAARMRIRDLLAHRSATQPTQWPNGGSVFRNPPGDHAARLIEAAGLKGVRQGGACISALHANFIVNDADATAADIEYLIELMRRRVLEVHGVLLETEVRVLGER
ncbi:MAG TPA: UDP-N-acetylmuramate dehydrogenase [Acidiferrobacteraceae bacterium]|nr:UDP-N-acetylmuramate dehydrogenase [Acidiferrobacteraceae bacterium]